MNQLSRAAAWVVALVVGGLVVDRLIRTLGQVMEQAAKAAGDVVRPDAPFPNPMPEDDSTEIGEFPFAVDPTDSYLPTPSPDRIAVINPGDSLIPGG